jgi:hypothetical protein
MLSIPHSQKLAILMMSTESNLAGFARPTGAQNPLSVSN